MFSPYPVQRLVCTVLTPANDLDTLEHSPPLMLSHSLSHSIALVLLASNLDTLERSSFLILSLTQSLSHTHTLVPSLVHLASNLDALELQ